MAEVLVPVISKIGWSLTQEAVKKLSKEVSSVKELPKKVEAIKTELTVINGIILTISTNYLDDKDRKEWWGWIEEVRTLAFKIEDVMDKYSYLALQRAGEGRMRKLIKLSQYGTALRGICGDITEIQNNLGNISTQRERWLSSGLLDRLKQTGNVGEQRPKASSTDYVKDDDLVGLDVNRTLLMKWLNSHEEASMVMTVSGMGGLGKSNLVWNVHQSERKKKTFNAYAWTIVSRTYSPEALLRELIEKLAGDGESADQSEPPAKMDIMSHNELKQKLEDAVKDKKCMVVLDDVWDDRAYKLIHDTFRAQRSASRIIITTRKRDELAPGARLRHRLEFQPLDYDYAHKLFCIKSSLDIQDCHREYRDLAKVFVKRCGEHPHAIISIAKQLSEETDWKQKCNQLRSELNKDSLVQGILRHTYYSLDEDLRNCFLCCSLFPQDYLLSREVLVRLWVAEGFVAGKEQNTPEVAAEINLRTLIQHNLLQPVEIDEFGEVVTCRMHPILRILSLSVSEAVKFGVANDYCTMQKPEDRVRRLSACLPTDNNASKCPYLRTLIAVGTDTSTPDKLSWISSESIYLAVLELQDAPLEEVPDSVGDLFNLRYLGLRRTKVRSLPESIRMLLNLQTLDLKSTNIKELPEGIKKLKRLRHLFADRPTGEKTSDVTRSEFQYFKGVTAPKGLSSMTELQTLESVEASMELGKQLEEVKQLSGLSIDNVKASYCKDLFASLFNMKFLSRLLLSASDLEETLRHEDIFERSRQGSCQTFENLQKLVVRGRLAEGMLQHLIFPDQKNKLTHLDLTSCQFKEEDPLQLLVKHLPELTYLSLSEVRSTSELKLPADKFRFLKTLLLKNMPDVQRLTIQGGANPRIEALYIATMPNLTEVPEGFQSLRSLQKLKLRGMTQAFRDAWNSQEWRQKLNIPDLSMEEGE